MRIIKFRIWDKNSFAEKMSYSKTESFDDMIGFRFEHFDSEPEDLVLMQYTGLKDMRGAEIYEGDIVEFARGRYQVGFLDGSFVLCDRNQWHIPFYTVHGGIEVIGNIYENPELMQNN